jgi:hypothetical protein
MLPYNHFGQNISELAVLGLQTFTLVVPLLGYMSILSWRQVGDTMILVQVGWSALRSDGR